MSDYTFYRLAPFIQDYIYRQGWTELRPAQVQACRVIFDTNSHLLLASGTASGKTEAAFLPILTMLSEDPSSTVGVLYYGPTKALINDQFYRLTDLLEEADIPVWHWHGDVSYSEKKKLLKNPSGVLQITPESMGSMLVNKPQDLIRLFGDLRFVIIDEIHSFMRSERGSQIICQLNRLSWYTKNCPRRIGLSATLGDYDQAEKWLAAGTSIPVTTVTSQNEKQRIRLSVEHFFMNGSNLQQREDYVSEPYWNYVFEKTKQRKCIIFTSSRRDSENSIVAMRERAEANGYPDIYHVYHSLISPSFREAAQVDMKESEGPCVTGATLSLEVGVDFGGLERVVQLQAPNSVSSFLQRLGRTGRRGGPAEMHFAIREYTSSENVPLPGNIPWSLIQSIAIIQLYLEERWVEPVRSKRFPFSLLYHQTMSIMASVVEISPEELAKKVLSLPPFKEITLQEFSELIRHLLSTDHLELTEERTLIIGIEGAKVVERYGFYSVFPDIEQYTVHYESQELGSFTTLLMPGELLTLTGRVWEVTEVDIIKKHIFVKPVKGYVRSCGTKDPPITHTKVLQRMRQVLLEDIEYPYLQPGALERLREARHFSRINGICDYNIIRGDDGAVYILPWIGTYAFRALHRCIKYFYLNKGRARLGTSEFPYYLTLRSDSIEPQKLYEEINDFCNAKAGAELIDDSEIYPYNRYDDYLPFKF
jgi:ATP-dependent Lhr-like helicase